LLSCFLMISAGALLLPKGINAELLGTVALVAQSPLGEIGLALALVGMFFAISGAAIDSALSGAYNVAQFFGWEWGIYRRPAGAPRFTIAWMIMLALGFAIVVTGVDPILVTELSVIFSVVALPLTYVPILLVANDRAYMRSHANGWVANAFGLFYLLVVLVTAVCAVPLLVLSNMGQG
jgi:manganese transport protein